MEETFWSEELKQFIIILLNGVLSGVIKRTIIDDSIQLFFQKEVKILSTEYKVNFICKVIHFIRFSIDEEESEALVLFSNYFNVTCRKFL